MSTASEGTGGDRGDTQRLVDEMHEVTRDLSRSVTELVGEHARQIRRLRVLTRVVVVGLILDLFLSVLGVRLFLVQRQNGVKLERVQARSSSEVLCPLWDRFLDSYNPQSPSALQDPRAYEESFKVIERGAVVLGCSHTTRGKN